jgi:hypothetical protein
MTKGKYISVLIGIALFCNFNNLKSQHVIPERKDNVIVITADTSTLTNFDKFAKHLIDNGYTFASIDRNFKIISTNERTSEGGYKHKLNISFTDSIITIRPTCNMLMLGSSVGNYQTTWIDWKYATSRSNIYNLHYRAFMPIISSFNKPILFYLKP